jgi:hypothetical protein
MSPVRDDHCILIDLLDLQCYNPFQTTWWVVAFLTATAAR